MNERDSRRRPRTSFASNSKKPTRSWSTEPTNCSPAAIQELKTLLAEQFPGRQCLVARRRAATGSMPMSSCSTRTARSAASFSTSTTTRMPRAKPNWAGSTRALTCNRDVPFEIDPLLIRVIDDLRPVAAALGGEVAHLKVIGLEEGGAFGVANLVSSATGVELSLPSQHACPRGRLDRECSRRRRSRSTGARGTSGRPECVCRTRHTRRVPPIAKPAPGRPTPTHRMATAVR